MLDYFLGEKLQGNKPPQFQILSLLNDPHSAAAKLFANAVTRNGLANHFSGNLRSRN
jgi:hypothetical protein